MNSILTPKKLVLFLTKRCNLRCPACQWILYDEDFFQNDDLELKNAYRIMNYYFDLGVREIFPQAEGEVLLYKNYAKVIDYSLKMGYKKSNLVTNGLLIHRFEQLILSKIKSLLISIDGYNHETYKFRRGGDKSTFDKLIANIKSIVRLRNDSNSKLKITLSCVLGKFNIDYLVPMIKLAESLEVDQLIFRSFHPSGDTDLAPLYYNDSETKSRLLKIIQSNDYNVNILMPSLIKSHTKPNCKMLFNTAIIGADGSFAPCCHIPTDKNFGNFYENPDSFGSGKINELRESFAKAETSEMLSKVCRRCPRLTPQTPSFEKSNMEWNNSHYYD